jgi:hypothetical protein
VATRVQLGKLPGGSYGLQLSGPDGTVIIDGTSNTFKIQAMGAISITAAASTMSQTSEVILTGLGTFASTPAHLNYIATVNLPTSRRFLGQYHNAAGIVKYAATSSGGSPNSASGTWDWLVVTATLLDADNYCVFRMNAANATAVSQDFFAFFYILKEVAM